MLTKDYPVCTLEQEDQKLKKARKSLIKAKKETLKYIEKCLNQVCKEESNTNG